MSHIFLHQGVLCLLSVFTGAVQFTAFLGDRFLCIIFCEAILQQPLFDAVNPVDSDSFYFLPLYNQKVCNIYDCCFVPEK